jgi:hypothetical protein
LSISCVYVWLMSRARLLAVRWDRLFDDLEAQLAASERAELAAEVSDRTRTEVARVHLLDRLRSAIGSPVDLTIEGTDNQRGVLARAGTGWLLVDVASRPEVVVAEHAILALRGLPVAAAEPTTVGIVESRLDFAHMMRAVARDRSAVSLVLRNGSPYAGTIDRVGADFVDLAEHAPDEPRRAAQVNALRTVPFAAISLVRPI